MALRAGLSLQFFLCSLGAEAHRCTQRRGQELQFGPRWGPSLPTHPPSLEQLPLLHMAPSSSLSCPSRKPVQEAGLGLVSYQRWTSPGDFSGKACGKWDLPPPNKPFMGNHPVGVEDHF